MIHAAFKDWFGIEVADESSDRHPAEALLAMTAEIARELQPKKLNALLSDLAAQRVEQARQRLAALTPEQRRRQMRTDWARLLGQVEPSRLAVLPDDGGASVSVRSSQSVDGLSIERIVLASKPMVVPVLLLRPRALESGKAARLPVVVGVSQAGKQKLLRDRRYR